jgi:GMP synthase PP-ATPase subunit
MVLSRRDQQTLDRIREGKTAPFRDLVHNKARGVNRALYDVTSRPPGTTE